MNHLSECLFNRVWGEGENHSTNLRLTVQIHSTFSRVVQALYEFLALQNNVTIVTTQDSCLIIRCLRVTIEAFSIVT